MVAALLRVVGVTADLAESNGSLLPGLWLTSPAGWLPWTGISSGTLRSVSSMGYLFAIITAVCSHVSGCCFVALRDKTRRWCCFCCSVQGRTRCRRWVRRAQSPGLLCGLHKLKHTHTQLFNGRWSGTTWIGRYQKETRPLTPILIIGHPLSTFSIYYDPGQRGTRSFVTGGEWECRVGSVTQGDVSISVCLGSVTCLTVLFDNLSPVPLWSSSWSWTLYFIPHSCISISIHTQHVT